MKCLHIHEPYIVHEDAHASVFEMVVAELVFILAFKFFDLVNRSSLTFHYCTILIK